MKRARLGGGAFGIAVMVAALLFGGAIAVPQALAFPHYALVGRYAVRSEQPIDIAGLRAVLSRADARLKTSAINQPGARYRVFLTDGGWRWHVLAFGADGAFALIRAISGSIVVNRSDTAADRVTNGQTIGGARPLSQVIAHEATHNLLRDRYGIFVDLTTPQWLREGYCDYVGGGGSLSDADVAMLTARHQPHPALPYYYGRKRVAAMLRANGGSVDALFGQRTPQP